MPGLEFRRPSSRFRAPCESLCPALAADRSTVPTPIQARSRPDSGPIRGGSGSIHRFSTPRRDPALEPPPTGRKEVVPGPGATRPQPVHMPPTRDPQARPQDWLEGISATESSVSAKALIDASRRTGILRAQLGKSLWTTSSVLSCGQLHQSALHSLWSQRPASDDVKGARGQTVDDGGQTWGRPVDRSATSVHERGTTRGQPSVHPLLAHRLLRFIHCSSTGLHGVELPKDRFSTESTGPMTNTKQFWLGGADPPAVNRSTGSWPD